MFLKPWFTWVLIWFLVKRCSICWDLKLEVSLLELLNLCISSIWYIGDLFLIGCPNSVQLLSLLVSPFSYSESQLQAPCTNISTQDLPHLPLHTLPIAPWKKKEKKRKMMKPKTLPLSLAVDFCFCVVWGQWLLRLTHLYYEDGNWEIVWVMWKRRWATPRQEINEIMNKNLISLSDGWKRTQISICIIQITSPKLNYERLRNYES